MHRHSDATLMGMTKKELVSYVRMAEHNYDVAREALQQQAENVKDWMPVVRCKDCKKARPLNRKDPFENMWTEGCVWCMEHGDGMWVEDFCSYGERKDNG